MLAPSPTRPIESESLSWGINDNIFKAPQILQKPVRTENQCFSDLVIIFGAFSDVLVKDRQGCAVEAMTFPSLERALQSGKEKPPPGGLVSIYMYTYIMYVYIYTHTYICVYMCIYVCIHIHTYIYTDINPYRKFKKNGKAHRGK